MNGVLHTMNDEGLMEFTSSTEGLMQIIEQLRGGGGTRLPDTIIHGYAKTLIERAGSIYQTYSSPKTLTLHRARWLHNPKNPLPLSKLDLGPPSPEKTIHRGRCHQPGNPVLYCSLYEDTALAEINAQTGERYLISTFSFQGDVLLMPVGEFDFYCRTGQTRLGQEILASNDAFRKVQQGEEIEYLHTRIIDAFFAEAFIKMASTSDDYKITSTFSKILFDEFPDKIHAFLYPSVAFREGLNFAFSKKAYDSKMEIVKNETKIIEITDALGFGIYNFKSTHILKSIDPEGTLEWDRLAE